MSSKRTITRADILPPDEYARTRAARRKAVVELKRRRRVEVGPYTTFHFENFDTMWQQIHEMLHIERGGEAQIEDELAAYNPLIPQGGELVATVMIEIEDAHRRRDWLFRLGSIENHMILSIDGTVLRAEPDPTRENTSPDGKASSVQFVRWAVPPALRARFANPDAQVMLGFDHPNYGHLATVPSTVRQALSEDFD